MSGKEAWLCETHSQKTKDKETEIKTNVLPPAVCATVDGCQSTPSCFVVALKRHSVEVRPAFSPFLHNSGKFKVKT